MNIQVIASTVVGGNATKDDFEMFGGRAAGVCYMAHTFDEILNEEPEKTIRRIKQTKTGGHHSVYEHCSFSLYLDGIPKVVAMIINNEKQYTTSEKSGRYTKMVLAPEEQVIYNKWLDVFKEKITNLYAQDYPQFFTTSRIEKLAQENARYLSSVFTPVSMLYTINYRQFNYLVSFLDKFIAKENKDRFETRLSEYLVEFVAKLKELPYYDEQLTHNEKCRSLSLFSNGRDVEEYFGDVYATTYKASFAELAQAQRHRTIDYEVKVLEGEFYVPVIIREDKQLVEEWLKDLKAFEKDFPHATLLQVNEMGTLDAFILKLKERKCTFAQLEINHVSIDTLNRYSAALTEKNHSRAEELNAYTKGSRCTFPDFKCTAPCNFALGITEQRKI